MRDLSTGSRKAIVVSMAAAGAVAVAAVVDLLLSYPFQPFAGMVWLDIAYLISSALVIYMGYDAWQSLRGSST